MSQFVTDTHALHWHLANDSRLSPAAHQLFHDADAGFHRIFICGITLIEMVYLVEKGRLDGALVDRVLTLLDTKGGSYAVAQLDQTTARAMRVVPRAAVPDMPDRIITATAYQLGVPLISRDARIREAGIVPVLW